MNLNAGVCIVCQGLRTVNKEMDKARLVKQDKSQETVGSQQVRQRANSRRPDWQVVGDGMARLVV